MKTLPGISVQERSQRAEAVRFARNSVALEGFHLSPEAELLFARYIDGTLSNDELNAAIRRLAGR